MPASVLGPAIRQVKDKAAARRGRPTGGSKFTPAIKEVFFKELARHGVIGVAAEAVGMTRDGIQYHLANDDEFAARVDAARQLSTDRLEAEVLRRATEGVEDPVYQQGRLVGHRRVFSDNLAMMALKGRRPDTYGDKSKVEVAGEIKHLGLIERVTTLVEDLRKPPPKTIQVIDNEGD